MSYDPSHPTILPSFTGTTSDAVSPALGTTHSSRANVSAPDSTLAPTPSGKKRRSSKMKSGKQLSRSTSTPQLRDEGMSDSDLEKKRNKLGYQRISIACAHCRRRKIRCLVAEGDPQQRCQNCIRLKKECVFYPVDQQSAMENNSEASSKPTIGSGPSSVVSSSPPIHGADFEQPRDLGSFQPLQSNAPASYQGLPLEPGSALPAQSVPRGFAQPDYGYRTQSEAPATWNAPVSTNHHQHHRPILTDGAGASSHSNWRYGQAGPPGDFAPFPTVSAQVSQSPQMVHPFAFAQSRNDSLWPQPQQPHRSMSYGNLDGPSSQSSTYGAPFIAQPVPLRYHPPSLDVQNATMTLQEPGPHSAPVGAQQASFNQPNPYMFQQDHGGVNHASLTSHQTYPGSWYQDASSFGSFEEEPENYGSRQQRPG